MTEEKETKVEEIIVDNNSQKEEKEVITTQKEEKEKTLEQMVKEEEEKIFLSKTIASLKMENEELKKQFETFKNEINEIKQNKGFYNETKISPEETKNFQTNAKESWKDFYKKIKGEI